VTAVATVTVLTVVTAMTVGTAVTVGAVVAVMCSEPQKKIFEGFSELVCG
jgi:hypothetical protein